MADTSLAKPSYDAPMYELMYIINPVLNEEQTKEIVQRVRSAAIDCDGDALLFRIEQVGDAACHTGHRSCFYRRIEDGRLVVDGEPVFDADAVYKA